MLTAFFLSVMKRAEYVMGAYHLPDEAREVIYAVFLVLLRLVASLELLCLLCRIGLTPSRVDVFKIVHLSWSSLAKERKKQKKAQPRSPGVLSEIAVLQQNLNSSLVDLFRLRKTAAAATAKAYSAKQSSDRLFRADNMQGQHNLTKEEVEEVLSFLNRIAQVWFSILRPPFPNKSTFSSISLTSCPRPPFNPARPVVPFFGTSRLRRSSRTLSFRRLSISSYTLSNTGFNTELQASCHRDPTDPPSSLPYLSLINLLNSVQNVGQHPLLRAAIRSTDTTFKYLHAEEKALEAEEKVLEAILEAILRWEELKRTMKEARRKRQEQYKQVEPPTDM